MKFTFFLSIAYLVVSVANGIRILFIVPCYGGHFGTMSPLIASLSYTNDVTLITTSPTCRNKISSLRKHATFEVIEQDIGWGNIQFEGFFEAFHFFAMTITERFRTQFTFLTEFLAKNRKKYDVMVADFTLDGALVAAEVADFPTAVIMVGNTGATEHAVDKMEFSLMESMFMQIIGRYHWNVLLSTRIEHKLAPLVYQNNFFASEYSIRFPTLEATSPLVYPELHPSVPHVFVGGIRNESHYDTLDPELLNWLDLSDKKVVYISLGTILKITESSLHDWVDKIRNQNEFRFIWFMNSEMQKLADNLNVQSDSSLYLSNFLPQFTLLSHKKVKALVTHGGLGSLTDVIKRRKPAICTPHLFDQPYNCKKIESLGAGVVSTFDFDKIMEALSKIFSRYDYYVANTNQVAENFESYEKREVIENFLSAVAAKGKASVILDFGFDLSSPKYARAWFITKISLLAILLVFLALLGRLCKCIFRKRTKKNVVAKSKDS